MRADVFIPRERNLECFEWRVCHGQEVHVLVVIKIVQSKNAKKQSAFRGCCSLKWRRDD